MVLLAHVGLLGLHLRVINNFIMKNRIIIFALFFFSLFYSGMAQSDSTKVKFTEKLKWGFSGDMALLNTSKQFSFTRLGLDTYYPYHSFEFSLRESVSLVTFQSDDMINSDYCFGLRGGIGYLFWKNNDQSLGIETGVGYNMIMKNSVTLLDWDASLRYRYKKSFVAAGFTQIFLTDYKYKTNALLIKVGVIL